MLKVEMWLDNAGEVSLFANFTNYLEMMRQGPVVPADNAPKSAPVVPADNAPKSAPVVPAMQPTTLVTETLREMSAQSQASQAEVAQDLSDAALQRALRAFLAANSNDLTKAIALLGEFGATKVTQIKTENRAEFLAKVKELVS